LLAATFVVWTCAEDDLHDCSYQRDNAEIAGQIGIGLTKILNKA